jgi:hypothetical protein
MIYQYTIHMTDTLKNKTFIDNITDPLTKKHVKTIYRMKITKLDREKWDLVWQYYRDRHRASIIDAYKKYEGYNIRVIYFKDPKMYYYYLDSDKSVPTAIDKPLHVPDPNLMRRKEKRQLGLIKTIVRNVKGDKNKSSVKGDKNKSGVNIKNKSKIVIAPKPKNKTKINSDAKLKNANKLKCNNVKKVKNTSKIKNNIIVKKIKII